MAFAASLDAVVAGDVSAVRAALEANSGLVEEEGVYDEVMESADTPSGIAMAPVIGTLLHVAAKYGQVDVARLLLDNGAEANRLATIHWHEAAVDSRTPLFLAVWSTSPELTALLLQRRAEVNQSCGASGAERTPLEEAAARGDTEIARILLTARRDSEDKDRASPDLETLLQRAIQAQQEDMAELLLDSGASASGSQRDGALPPLHLATRHNCPGIVRLLLERGANASSEGFSGESLLSIAAAGKAQLEEWVGEAEPGPMRDWRQRVQEQHSQLTQVLLNTGTLQEAPGSLRHVLTLFQEIDRNRNGLIEREELLHVLRSMDATAWTEERVDQLVAAADANKDGLIQLEEFLTWVFSPDDKDASVIRAAAATAATANTAPAAVG